MLTFIDESGYPRPTDSTRNPILLGVCIHENDIKPITNQIYKLKDSIYGKQDEIKSTKLIREATITKNRSYNELVRIVFTQVSNSLFKGKHTFHTQTFVESQVRFVSYAVIGCSIDDCLVESEDRIFFRE